MKEPRYVGPEGRKLQEVEVADTSNCKIVLSLWESQCEMELNRGDVSNVSCLFYRSAVVVVGNSTEHLRPLGNQPCSKLPY